MAGVRAADTNGMENPSSPNTKVFIADDSASMRERLGDMLGDIEGVVVVGEADTPAAAVEGIFSTRPDSVVLDIHLLGGTGLEVLRQVHPLAPKIVFVVLTNYPNPQYQKAYLDAGASHFLDKSTGIETVAKIIAELGAKPH